MRIICDVYYYSQATQKWKQDDFKAQKNGYLQRTSRRYLLRKSWERLHLHGLTHVTAETAKPSTGWRRRRKPTLWRKPWRRGNASGRREQYTKESGKITWRKVNTECMLFARCCHVNLRQLFICASWDISTFSGIGYGIQVWANGNKYEGDWMQGYRHGHGVFWVKKVM